MKLTAFSSLISLIVVIASAVVSVAVTASEQPLLRASDSKDVEVSIRSTGIQVDVPVSASEPDDTTTIVNTFSPQSRELDTANSSYKYEKEKLQDRVTKSSSGTAVIKVGAVTETEMKDEKFEKSKEHDRVTSAVRVTTAFYDDCTDDESFRYGYINKKGKSKLKGGCSDFVARRKKKRCRKRMIDNRKVREYCPLTCSSCKKMTNGGNKMCGIENFIGAWQYASPCGGGGVFELTIRCDDSTMKKHNTKCYVRDKKIMNATDDGGLVDIKRDETCVREGVVRTDDVLYNSITGNCLLPFVVLDGGTCDKITEGFGLSAEIAAAAVSDQKKETVMKIKFSVDEGHSYYNDATPYEGYFVPSGGSHTTPYDGNLVTSGGSGRGLYDTFCDYDHFKDTIQWINS